ncbi:hypothetical protein SLG_25140 [Sphingobium sp. SYK-6]|uniref:hypothetical protein n=1 Tax=Sphingobium sp. (strain NBRC 103272 / SYK-6) TaxID=627192 RepID=UPI0002277590|nr:hypothetical protein [Sphingobium sp. SYK-6]BAK67189.1 hypothetical protein SLG_25140 [Sphingobium sp. SYK-6]
MKKRRLALLAAPLLLMAQAGKAEAGADCDRACLEGLGNAYLAALAAKDAAGLPLSAGARYTENGQTMALGDGMWASVTGVGPYRLHFSDVKTGETALFAEVEENGTRALLNLRLRVVDRKISEMEAIVAREDKRPLEASYDKPAFHAVVPPAKRSSRAELIRIADSYFEGIVQATGKLTPFHPDCIRFENGTQTTSSKAERYVGTLHAVGCQAQFDSGFSKFVTDVRERRFPIVDEERGLVYSIMFWDHRGNIPQVTLADGKVMKVPYPFTRPFTLMMGELFKIEEGKIRQIEAAHLAVPYKMPSGWVEKRP